jgi:simple sugar transport system permease protein
VTSSLARRLALSAAAPTIALAFAVLMSSIVLVLAGSNPFEAYADMVQHAAKLETFVDILNRATPLYIAGVAVAIGFRMNLFNIGVEGQFLLAALVAAHVGGQVDLPAVFHVGLILLVAMAVGGGYAAVPGILKVTRGVNEVVSTIMLNAIAASGLVAWLLTEWQASGGVAAGTNTRVGTEPIAESGLIPNLNSWVEVFTRDIGQGKELTGVLLIAIAVGLAYHTLLTKVRFGFDLRASGINPLAARAGGVPPKRMIVTAMVLSGAVAGLIGVQQIMQEGLFPSNPVRGLGFAGIGIALLGRNHPGGIAVGALIFSFLDISSGILQSTGSASREIVVIMQGIIILAAVVAYEVVQRFRDREEAREAAAALAGSAA